MLRLGILMDPIGSIKVKKDSSFAMLLAAQKRGWELLYMEQADLFLRDGRVYAHLRKLRVQDDPKNWFELEAPHTEALEKLDILLMRKDPPFDMEYIYTTHLLDRAEAEGVLVVNKPASLRDCNEKLYTAWFPDCCAPTLVTRSHAQLREFLVEHGDIVMKPLHGMGGESIFRVRADDPNTGVILETLTEHGHASPWRSVSSPRSAPATNAF